MGADDIATSAVFMRARHIQKVISVVRGKCVRLKVLMRIMTMADLSMRE